ncbi:MAG: DUF3137 domain-containing protein [Wujia sp.]
MKHEFYGIVLASFEKNSETTRIIFIAIVVLLVLSYISSYKKNKKSYDKMMSSVMVTPGDESMIGGKTYVWQNQVDASTMSAYRKDYASLKIHNLWRVVKSFIVIFGVAIGVSLIWIMHRKTTLEAFWSSADKIFMLTVLLFLLVVGIELTSPSSTMISDDSVMYSRLVPMMIGSLFGADAVYSRTRAMDSEKLMKLNFYEHTPDEIKGSDYISGIYKGVKFECGYENAEYTEKDGDGDKITYSAFRGLMLVIPYRKKSGSMLGLRGKTEQEMKDGKGVKTSRNRIGRTENDKFNRLFNIMSRDDENLYYMLTPDTMEKLIILYENFGGFSKKIHVCFSEELLYIGVPLGNYLRHKSVAPNAGALGKVQQKMWNDLNVVRAVLDLALTF